MNIRKILIILIILIIIGAIAAGVYFGLQKSQKETLIGLITQKSLPVATSTSQSSGVSSGQGTSTGQTSGQGQILADQKQRLSIYSTQPAIDYWVTPAVSDKSTSTPPEQFYVNSKGEIVQIKGANEENVISSASDFGTPVSLTQNVNGSKIIVRFNTGKFAIFDTKGKVWSEMENGIFDAAFSPSGSNVVFAKRSGNVASIYTKNISSAKSPVTLVATFSVQDFNLNWPEANKIFMIPKPAYGYVGEIWYFDLSNKTLNQFSSGRGLSVIFSYSYNYGLEFVNQERSKIGVSIVDKTGKKLADMPFSTIFDKCSFAFDQKVAYCAISESFSPGEFILPDDYLKGGLITVDSIYKISMDSSEIVKIIDSRTAQIDATDLKAVGSNLYFINRYDGKVYKFDMSQ
jgi:hypothetical protein